MALKTRNEYTKMKKTRIAAAQDSRANTLHTLLMQKSTAFDYGLCGSLNQLISVDSKSTRQSTTPQGSADSGYVDGFILYGQTSGNELLCLPSE